MSWSGSRKGRYGIPWSGDELDALKPYVEGRLTSKYRNSWHAARSYLADLEERGSPSPRTPNAVHLRICRMIPGTTWEFSAAWSREELRVIDRHVRSLARSDGYAASEEINACAADIRRLRARHPKAIWAQADRGREAVRPMMQSRARRLRRRWAGSIWSKEENRIAEPYAQDLVRCRWRSATEPARRCREELELLRRRDPSCAARRTLHQVTAHVRLRANALGWSGCWTPLESRILDGCIRALSLGKYHNAAEAAAAFRSKNEKVGASGRHVRHRTERNVIQAIHGRARVLCLRLPGDRPIGEEDERLAWYAGQVAKGRIRSVRQTATEFLREYQDRGSATWRWAGAGRSLWNVQRVISKRAKVLGRPPTRLPWGAEEDEVCERFVRRVVAGEFRSVAQAAGPCRVEIERLHGRCPDASWSRSERTLGAVKMKMELRIQSLGARWWGTSFSNSENRVLDRYSRLLVEGGIPKITHAVELCLKELELRHRRYLARHPELPRGPQPRTASAILTELSTRSIRMGRPQRRLAWTEHQVEIARKWAARCGHGTDRLSKAAAGRGCAAELKREGFQRDPMACTAFIFKFAAGWRPGKPSGQGKGNPETLPGQDGDSNLPAARTAPDKTVRSKDKG